MSEQALLTILQIVGALITGILIARYTNIAQKPVRKISYITSSIELTKIHEKTPEGIRVTADKSLFTGNPEDTAEQIQIDNAYAHSLSLKNKGNESAEDLFFTVEFDDSAKIISHTSSPESYANSGVITSISKEHDNILEVRIPYMNPSEPLQVSIIRTGTPGEDKFVIAGGGKGVEIEQYKEKGTPLAFLVTLVCLVAVAVFYDSSSGGFGEVIPETWINILGGSIVTETVKIAEFPAYQKAIATFTGVFVAIGFWVRAIKKSRF